MRHIILPFCSLVAVLLISCGGQESYKTPYVLAGGVMQSDCMPPDEWKKESFDVSVHNREITLTHENILLPKYSVIGIEDSDGFITWEKEVNRDISVYYLEGDEEYISVRERIRHSSVNELCYYNVSIRIKHISAGEYELSLFDGIDALIFTEDIDVR